MARVCAQSLCSSALLLMQCDHKISFLRDCVRETLPESSCQANETGEPLMLCSGRPGTTPWSSHTSDWRLTALVATLPDACCYRVTARAGWTGSYLTPAVTGSLLGQVGLMATLTPAVTRSLLGLVGLVATLTPAVTGSLLGLVGLVAILPYTCCYRVTARTGGYPNTCCYRVTARAGWTGGYPNTCCYRVTARAGWTGGYPNTCCYRVTARTGWTGGYPNTCCNRVTARAGWTGGYPNTCCYRVTARTGWTGLLWLSEIASLNCSFCLRVAD